MDWTVQTFETMDTATLYEILQARVDVFVVEQNCPYHEIDGDDPVSLHLIGRDENGSLTAYARILPPGVKYEKEASIGRVLVHPSFRGRGLARELMQQALDSVPEQWKKAGIILHAQAYLRHFYAAFAFEEISEVYLEDNIEHVEMLLK